MDGRACDQRTAQDQCTHGSRLHPNNLTCRPFAVCTRSMHFIFRKAARACTTARALFCDTCACCAWACASLNVRLWCQNRALPTLRTHPHAHARAVTRMQASGCCAHRRACVGCVAALAGGELLPSAYPPGTRLRARPHSAMVSLGSSCSRSVPSGPARKAQPAGLLGLPCGERGCAHRCGMVLVHVCVCVCARVRERVHGMGAGMWMSIIVRVSSQKACTSAPTCMFRVGEGGACAGLCLDI